MGRAGGGGGGTVGGIGGIVAGIVKIEGGVAGIIGIGGGIVGIGGRIGVIVCVFAAGARSSGFGGWRLGFVEGGCFRGIGENRGCGR